MINFHNVSVAKTAYVEGDFPAILPEVAFVGRSNVGKSSMLNRLINRKRMARVSSSPGKTRSVNFFCVDNKMYLTDLPGYGFAKVSWGEREDWRRLIESYFAAGRDIRLIVMIVDARHAPSKEDQTMVDYLCSLDLDFIICASKADKLSKSAVEENCRMIADQLGVCAQIIPFSAVCGEGKDRLINIIKERCSNDISEVLGEE